jgi:hypothetical protein
MARSAEEGPQLLGRPDLPKTACPAARTLGPFSWVRYEQLLRPNRVVEGFAQDRMYVINRCP